MTIHRKEDNSMDMKNYINGVTYDLNGAYGVGYTHKGEKFLFDKEDFDKIKNYRWHFDGKGYLVAKEKGPANKNVKIHQVIMGKAPKGKLIDHIRSTAECLNRKADNRKENLRFVTPAQNSMNRERRSDNASGHTGVRWEQKRQRWLARVRKGKMDVRKRFPYDQFREACLWQEKTAKKMFGKYAYVNCSIPPQIQQAEPGL